MFNFLKKKLKGAISSISSKAEEEAETVEKPEEKEKPAKEKPEGRKKPGKEKKAVKEPAKKKEAPAEEKPSKGKKSGPSGKKPAKKKNAEEAKENPSGEKAKAEKEEPDEKPGGGKEEERAEEEGGFFGKLKRRFSSEEKKDEKEGPAGKKADEEGKADEEEAEAEEGGKKGLFSRVREAVSTKMLTKDQFERLFWELEVALLENNVAMEVVEKIKEDMKESLVNKRIQRGKFAEMIEATLHDSISSLFDTERTSLIKEVKKKKPYVVAFLGVNGSGKTTTIAKVARLMQENKLKPVIAAADTFRAAAIQQLEEHGSRLGVKVIKHDYGSDPAAVAFDAIKYAGLKGLDIVLIDTAGRQHSNANLMDEMKKIVRVAKPDLKVFVGESITGNDCIEQAKAFNEAVGIDAIILTKADVDEKGGAAVSVSYVTGKPIIYMGMGQAYDDLKEFNRKVIMENIGLA